MTQKPGEDNKGKYDVYGVNEVEFVENAGAKRLLVETQKKTVEKAKEEKTEAKKVEKTPEEKVEKKEVLDQKVEKKAEAPVKKVEEKPVVAANDSEKKQETAVGDKKEKVQEEKKDEVKPTEKTKANDKTEDKKIDQADKKADEKTAATKAAIKTDEKKTIEKAEEKKTIKKEIPKKVEETLKTIHKNKVATVCVSKEDTFAQKKAACSTILESCINGKTPEFGVCVANKDPFKLKSEIPQEKKDNKEVPTDPTDDNRNSGGYFTYSFLFIIVTGFSLTLLCLSKYYKREVSKQFQDSDWPFSFFTFPFLLFFFLSFC